MEQTVGQLKRQLDFINLKLDELKRTMMQYFQAKNFIIKYYKYKVKSRSKYKTDNDLIIIQIDKFFFPLVFYNINLRCLEYYVKVFSGLVVEPNIEHDKYMIAWLGEYYPHFSNKVKSLNLALEDWEDLGHKVFNEPQISQR